MAYETLHDFCFFTQVSKTGDKKAGVENVKLRFELLPMVGAPVFDVFKVVKEGKGDKESIKEEAVKDGKGVSDAFTIS